MDAIQVYKVAIGQVDNQKAKSQYFLMATSSLADSYSYSNSWISPRILGFLCAICVESKQVDKVYAKSSIQSDSCPAACRTATEFCDDTQQLKIESLFNKKSCFPKNLIIIHVCCAFQMNTVSALRSAICSAQSFIRTGQNRQPYTPGSNKSPILHGFHRPSGPPWLAASSYLPLVLSTTTPR